MEENKPKDQEPAATPDKTEKTKEVPAFRTYRSDIAEYTKKSGTSYVDIITQAAKRKMVREEVARPGRKWLYIYIGIGVFALAVAAVASYFIFFRQPTTAEPAPLTPPKSVITYDTRAIIEFKTGRRDVLLDQIQSYLRRPQISGRLTYLPIKEKFADGSEAFLNTEQFVRVLETNPPRDLVNYLSANFTLGVLDTFGQNEIIIAVPISDYDRVFAMMLRWEKNLAGDFRSILPKYKSSDTGNSAFTDVVIQNQDARAIYNLEGQPVLAYTIFNRKLLVITSSRTAMEEMVKKMIKSPPTL